MDTSQTLYQDFHLTLENCHEEPIHRPVAIQGHGHMLVFTGGEHACLHAVTEQFASLIERETDSLWSESPRQWLPEIFQTILATATKSTSLCSYSGHWEANNGEIFDLIYHGNDDCIVLELEPVKESQIDSRAMPAIARNIRATTDLNDLYEAATYEVASLYGFDRVMVYQFDEAKHGCVVGEHKRDDLEAFLGLHYPESDIPKIARDMFLQVRSRFIASIHVRNDSLLFNPAPLDSIKSPYLDLTYSQLRAISPVHIEYLGNMGVQSTMTLSLVIEGKLWGLIACHHYSPKLIRFDARSIAEVIGDLVAKRINELEISERQRTELASRAVEDRFLDKLRLSENYRIELLEHVYDTLNMCKADGVALVTLKDVPFSTGKVPDKSTLLAVRDWLVDNGHDEVFSTSEFDVTVCVNPDSEKPIGGLLASCLSNISNSYLLWFRDPVSQSVFWAGDPGKAFSVSKSEASSEVRLSPRESFAKWQVRVEGQSKRWEPGALQMALRVRESIVRKELLYTADLIERSNSEFMQLTYAAVHDLQEPLRTQNNYLELLEEMVGVSSEDEQRKYLSITKDATERMRELINDLLSFASIVEENNREVISLEETVSALQGDLASAIQSSSASIQVSTLPDILSDSHKIRQLLLNLLTNALKYVDSGRAPVIKVYAQVEEGVFWNLCVQDNGIGIENCYFETIFKLFQRLHRKSEYAGTGIGLATCKKIAESMGGSISVDSVVGEGSIFRVKFHKSVIID